jgi:hypothetical protein
MNCLLTNPRIHCSLLGGRKATRLPSRSGIPFFSRSVERVGKRTVIRVCEDAEGCDEGAGDGECALSAGDERRIRFVLFEVSPRWEYQCRLG